ncbi:hypothetical protein EBR66_02420 [bacterium]|jgi:hypothetical protein|nr:hypothetical protein [bacterium]
MSGETPKLEPRHLFEKRVARDAAKLRAYNQVLLQIQTRIKMTSSLSGNPSYLVYTVPPFIIGLPAIDLQDCIVYVVHQLRTNGFEVRFTYPNLLFISWKHYEQEYMREQNPITQAMKPPPANSSKKGVGGKRGTGAIGTAQKVTFAPDLSRIGGAPATPRSAAEYKPPDSFLDGIQRPTKPPPGNPTESVLAQLWKF